MKILMVNKFLYARGGAESYTIKVGKHLEKMGHEVQYFGMYDEKNILSNKENQYTKNLDFHKFSINTLLYPLKIIYSFEAKKKIRKIIKSFKPDIVHLNNINFQLTPSIIEEAYKHNVKIVQTLHDYQFICPNHSLMDNKKIICEKCLSGNTFNCVKGKCIHGSLIKSVIGWIEACLYKYLKTYEKISYFVCPSKFLEQKFLTNDIYKGKTKHIQNYVELPDKKEELYKEEYVLYFGRLSEEKGLALLKSVIEELPDVSFKIAGSGPLEDLFKDMKNVDFVGFKTGKDLENLIESALFTVYPSIWYENCPLSILESQALGTPVITMDYGGMKELVNDYETGLLVEKATVPKLSSVIKKLYNDRKLLSSLTDNCISKRSSLISLESYCDEIVKIYGELHNK